MDGIIIINKPKGYTSHDIVQKTRKILNEKVGHTGTLDPNATGVLPLLVGKGTLLSKYLINHDKTYRAVLQLGEKRDTGDIEGKIVESKEVPSKCLEDTEIKKVLENMIGKQEQVPPIYSAIKVKGKKLYEYARKGENVEIKPRQIEIYNMKLIHIDIENKTIEFEIKCSKGTYIRTICEEIAEKLGTIGYMKNLSRLQVGEFYIQDSIKIEEIENEEILKNKFISIEKYFKENENIYLDERKKELFLNGVRLTFEKVDGIYKIYDKQNQFIGIGNINNNLLKRDIVI